MVVSAGELPSNLTNGKIGEKFSRRCSLPEPLNLSELSPLSVDLP